MCDVEAVYHRVDCSVQSRYGIIRIVARVDLSLCGCYRSLYRRVVGALEDKSLGSVNYRLSVSVDVGLMRDVEAVNHCIDCSIQSGHGIIRVVAGVDLSLCGCYRSLYRRVVGSLEDKSLGSVNYRLCVAVNVGLMCDVEAVYHRVDCSVQSRYGFVRVVARVDLRLCGCYRSQYRRVIGILVSKSFSGRNYRSGITVYFILTCCIKIVHYCVDCRDKSVNRFSCVLVSGDLCLSRSYRRLYRRVIGALEDKRLGCVNNRLSVCVNLILTGNVEAVINRVDGRVESRYGFIRIFARIDLRLCRSCCRNHRRVVCILEGERLGGVNYRLCVAVNVGLMCDVEAVNHCVDCSVQSRYGIIRVVAGVDLRLCGCYRSLYRRVVGILVYERRRRSDY